MALQASISALMGRVGWRQYPASFPFALTDENKKSESGRYFQDFNALVTLTNIKSTMEDAQADKVVFNEALLNMQYAAISAIASGILRESANIELSQAVIIFGDVAKESPALFDEAIGLQVACSAVEMIMLSTTRSNAAERDGKERAQMLFAELNGMLNESGAIVSVGLKNRLARELKYLRARIFPKPKPFITTPKFN